ncbi:MAG: hypothetical protein H6718_36290 [Polyangiaceae bacterium]|nr:hypothetical protein [Myxococcales bacterium]MCB9590922.1 hypothetical protein [Polyangiaceae bacterium]
MYRLLRCCRAGAALCALFLLTSPFTGACSGSEFCRQTGDSIPCNQLSVRACDEASGCKVTAQACSQVDCVPLDAAACKSHTNCGWYLEYGGCATKNRSYCVGELQRECETLPDCSWGPACSGRLIDCVLIDGESECSRVPHCEWEKTPALH